MLVTCRECGKERSSHAKICPHCGLDVEEDYFRRMRNSAENEEIERQERAQSKAKKAQSKAKAAKLRLAFERNPELKIKRNFWRAMLCLPVLLFIYSVIYAADAQEQGVSEVVSGYYGLLSFAIFGFLYTMLDSVNDKALKALKALSKSDKKKSKRQK